MGKRCRLAAWGATFALLVAACATTDSTTHRSSGSDRNSAASPPDALGEEIPDSLASVDAGPGPNEECSVAVNPELGLYDVSDGSLLWSTPIPRPGGQTVLHDDVVFFSYSFDRQTPGVGAVDLATRSSRWRRIFDDEPEQLVVVGGSLIVVTRDTISALDVVTGDDEWSIGSEFEFTEAIVEGEWAYAINNVAVHGINLRTGELTWQLPIERPDELAARGGLLAVAARNRIIAVDSSNRTFLWDEQVNRLASGDMWIGPEAVIVELAPSESPSGGLAALDRVAGFVRWRRDSVGDVRFPSADQLLTTVASSAFRGAQPYDLMAIDVTSGEPRWTLPTTADSGSGLLSVGDGRALLREPHPALPGVSRLRLIDTDDGTVLWEVSSTEQIDGAAIENDLFVSTYRTRDSLVGPRGRATMILGPGRSWSVDTTDGVEQDLLLSDSGVVVLSGERSAVCVGRTLNQPTGSIGGESSASLSLRAG